jgi:signal transduction histidine kinase
MRPLGQRSGVLLLAFVMFLLTVTLRVVVAPEEPVLTLLTVPVAVIAFEFGWRLGVAAAAGATLWVLAWHQLDLTLLGYLTRGGTYLLTALVVGIFADRLRAAQEASVASQRHVAELQLERQERVAAEAAERERLAREVHDVLAHSVSVMTVQSTAARTVIERDPQRAAVALEAIEQTGRHALAEIRRVISVLRPVPGTSDLSPQRGIGDLDALAEQVRTAGLAVSVRFEGERPAVPAAVDLSVYRIVQEALTNTLRHAEARTANVVVRYAGGGIDVECTDDGIGPGSASNGGGHGLDGMRERALVLGGELNTGPGAERGYRVHAWLPLDPQR